MVFYTDNCCADRGFWTSIFPTLKAEDILDVYKRDGVASFPHSIDCTRTPSAVDRLCRYFLESCTEIGFDVEWECPWLGMYDIPHLSHLIFLIFK